MCRITLQRHFRLASAVLTAVCNVFAACVQAAVQAQPQQTQPAPAAPTLAEEHPMPVFRAPLLREGTSLVEAVGMLGRGSEHDGWALHVQPANPAMPPYSLVVLPSTRLAEMERIVEAGGVDSAPFQVTGRVYVFRDRNYILLTHAALTGPAPNVVGPTTAPELATSAPAASSPGSAPAPHDDSAEAIARSLEAAAGPIARSSGIARPMNPQVDAGPSATTVTALQENAVVVNRRGKITRDRGGGWILVLDADATGLADPPLRLLPCMLLEGIEEYARREGNNSPVIITGQVFSYHGQNHLLPTVYRIPREGSRITP